MDESDRVCLDLFVQRVAEMLDRRIIKSGGLRADLNIKFGQDQPLTLQTQQPDEEDLRSFLVVFRQFVSKGEPIYLGRIAGLVWRHLEGDVWREQLEVAREHWKASFKTGSLAITVNEQQMRPETVLDLWINGLYFHNDARKREALERIDDFSLVFVRNIFLGVLVDTTRYLVFLANVIIQAHRGGLLF